MKRKGLIFFLLLSSLLLATCTLACNSNEHDSSASSTTAETKEDENAFDTEDGEEKTDLITEEQALYAIENYCYEQNPDLKEMVDSNQYTIYWDVSTSENGKIVVLYRSYTAAEIRYYIDPKTGDTMVTELVPGIVDEEEPSEETLNIRDYLD